MICQTCHGTGRGDPEDTKARAAVVRNASPLVTRAMWHFWRTLDERRAKELPCPDCGGSGRMHCCDGLRAQPDDKEQV